MENLNKKNFWDEKMKTCPAIMKHFCKFVDEYKREHKWDKLFHKKIKFHDIPIEMQTGIVVSFIMRITNQPNQQFENSKQFITAEFEHIEKKLTQLN